ncbi:unnamed protein product [Urochloa humidicola]
MAGASARWLVLLLVAVSTAAAASGKQERWRMSGRVGGQVVEKERRRVVTKAEAGTVTAVDVADAAGTAYRLHFITMDPGALFLPVQLHADMVFYVHSGRGKVTYIEEDSGEQSSLEVERGDVYNLEQGSILYIQSYPNATRQRLRIYAIFTSEGINADDPWKPKVEAYSSVSNLVKGFETEVLRLGFGVQREVAEAIKSAKTPPSIIPYNPEEKGDDKKPNWTEDIVDALLGVRDPEEFLNKKKKDKHKHKDKGKKSKSKAFNFYSGKPDVHNCYGWSKTMTNKDLDALHGSNIGMFMVNLTTGSMMGPHWNPKATEIAIVTDGSGIVQTVCPSSSSSSPSDKSRKGRHHGDERGGPGGRGDEGDKGGGAARGCRNSVFRVKEGDVFVVPRFHPMAQMSFNNDSFVFVGFSTHMGQNHPQFLAGKGSVLQAIGKEVLALSLGQKNSSAVEKLLSAQRDSTILSCISCAEELEEKAAEEDRRQREEEERKREQEEREKKEREEEERRTEKEKEKREREEERRTEKEEKREREEEERRKEQRGEEGARGGRTEERKREGEEEEERRKEQEEKEKREREEEERREEQEERERREREEEEQREQEEMEREEEERQRRKEEERARREEEERRREEEEGGGGRGDEPETEDEDEGADEPLYRLSKKLKESYRAGTFRSG